MNRITTRALGVVAGVALTVSAAPAVAHAAGQKPEPCATQQTQLDRAETQLARIQAVFAKQKQHVKQAKKDVAKADTRAERRNAKADLARAKEKKAHVAKEKKAQMQRVARATTRLDKCTAAQAG